MKLIAVKGSTFLIEPVGTIATITALPLITPVKVDGKEVLDESFEISVTAVMNTVATIPDPALYKLKFTATSLKVKVDKKKVLLIGDKVTFTAKPNTPNPAGAVVTPIVVTITILTTPQISMKGI